MAGIGDLVVNLGANTAPLSKGIASATSQLKTFAGGVGAIIAPVAGALGAIWGTSSSISGFRESLAAQNKLAAVLKATGGAVGLTKDEITSYSSELQSLTNFEDDATTSAAAMLATFTNIRGDIFKEAIEQAMNLSTVMGGDLASKVLLLGKALTDPIDGLAKLAEVGIQFTESQKATIKAMQATGDVAGAQKVILGQLEGSFGGAARAVADPWTQLQNTIGDVGESIGSLLLPSVNVLATGLSGLLTIVGEVIGGFQSFGIEAAVTLSHIPEMIPIAVTAFE
ncbi:MAG: hypothetical protein FJ267_19375, partial [Planctomycetes bacterium]|nr:hypothetical protein [Planctomycetota bacterium]